MGTHSDTNKPEDDKEIYPKTYQIFTEYDTEMEHIQAIYRSVKGDVDEVRRILDNLNIPKRKDRPVPQKVEPPKQIANHPHNHSNTPAPLNASSEDTELQKAIALSLASAGVSSGGVNAAEDPELAAALEASKQTLTKSQADVIDLTGDGESELQNVLMDSLMSAQGKPPVVTNDPISMKRTGEIPVGLKNVGNTCYFNSLIQTYYMIPILRKAVISYSPHQEVSAQDKNYHNFMVELQKLFASLVMSSQKFVDPSALLKSILDDKGNPVKIGAQEDVSEFNDLFINRLTKGLELAQKPIDPNAMNASFDNTVLLSGNLNRMFIPKAVERIESVNGDGSPYVDEKALDFGRNFILPLNSDTTLFEALDQFMTDEIPDYETPSGHKAPAKLSKWLEHIPEILVFQQQRVMWEGASQKKQTSALKFPDKLYMDRYLRQHMESTNQIRQENKVRMDRLVDIKTKISPHINFQNDGVPLDKLLLGTMAYLESKQAKSPELVQTLQQQISLLKQFQQEEKRNLDELQVEQTHLEQEIDNAYAATNGDEYQLFAIWIHSGVASGGHYWAYIKDVLSDSWYKFNDTMTTSVDLQTVMEDGIGRGSTSAYFMIYIKQALYERCKSIQDKSEGMPPQVMQFAVDQNAEFEKKLEEHQSSSIEGKISKFVSSCESKMTQTAEYASSYTLEKDMRYYSFFAYLLSLGLQTESQAAVVSEMWMRTFQRGIGVDQSSPAFEKCCQLPSPGTSVIFDAVAYATDPAKKAQMQSLTDQHKQFREIFMFTQTAIQKMAIPDPIPDAGVSSNNEALRMLYLAYNQNDAVKQEATKRTDLRALLQVSMITCLQEAIDRCTTHMAQTLSLLEDLVFVVLKLQDVADEPLRARILDVMLSTLPEKQENFRSDGKMERLQEQLMAANVPTDQKWEMYPVPAMPEDLGAWETLILRSRDNYQLWKRKFANIMADHRLEQVDILKVNQSAPESAATSQTTTASRSSSTFMEPSQSSMEGIQYTSDNMAVDRL